MSEINGDQYEEEDSEEETQAPPEPTQESAAPQAGHSKTWYPYITKTQFEKFVSRLQNKMPEQIDRDYVRAIIRTPSMIYRFLRGIEAMRLIDREHRPTDRLRRLIVPETRKEALGEVVRDLYPELFRQWEQNRGDLPDHEVMAFFRRKTGMGNDSATKMRMFFKFLMSEAELNGGDSSSLAPAAASPSAPPPRHVHAAEPERLPAHAGRGPEQRGQGAEQRGAERDRGAAPEAQQSSYQDRPFNSGRGLSEAQRAYLETLQGVLKINIDGDWDEDMIRIVFDRLDRLFERVRRG